MLENEAQRLPTDLWTLFDTRSRIILSIVCLVAFLAFWWLGRVFSIPCNYGYDVSLLAQPHRAADLLVTAALFLALLLLASLLTSSVRPEAGLFAACIGLAALSTRGGPMRCTLQGHTTPHIFLDLALELAALSLLLLIAATVMRLIGRRIAPRQAAPGGDDLTHKFAAAAVQIFLTVLCLLILAQSDAKAQVLCAVFIASWVGAAAAHTLFPLRTSLCFWTGPLVAGLLGYLVAYASARGDPSLIPIGITNHPLARPLPLDYASLGPAGALLGYWMSGKWHVARQLEQHSPAAAQP
jgi:hypothetical protein